MLFYKRKKIAVLNDPRKPRGHNDAVPPPPPSSLKVITKGNFTGYINKIQKRKGNDVPNEQYV